MLITHKFVSLPDVHNAKNVRLPDVDSAKSISLPDVNGKILLSPLMKEHVEMVVEPLSIGDTLFVYDNAIMSAYRMLIMPKMLAYRMLITPKMSAYRMLTTPKMSAYRIMIL
jgi:hypothetical protein